MKNILHEEKVIENAWKNINKTISIMERPPRLFKIIPKKTALLVIDMQNCFCAPGGSIEIKNTRTITPNINKITKQCRQKQIPIIWIKMMGDPTRRNTGLWRLFQPNSPLSKTLETPQMALSKKSNQSKLWKDLELNKKDEIISKKRYSALITGSSKLNTRLKKLKKDTVIITGVGTNVCCESTARDAMMLNYKVIVINDANATFNNLFHEISLMNIKLFFGDVISTKELLKEIS